MDTHEPETPGATATLALGFVVLLILIGMNAYFFMADTVATFEWIGYRFEIVEMDSPRISKILVPGR
jgi:hypothetical protein